MGLPKINVGQILNIVALAQTLIAKAQDVKNAPGPEKKAAVIAGLKSALREVEIATGRNLLNDELFMAAVDRLVETEVAAMKAKAAVFALIADAKAGATT
jgi:hypothetical protein